MIRFVLGLGLTAAGVFGAKYLLQRLPVPDQSIAKQISTMILALLIMATGALVVNVGVGHADPRRMWAQPVFVEHITAPSSRAIFILHGYNGDGKDISNKLPWLKVHGDVYSLKSDPRGFSPARIADKMYDIIRRGGYDQIMIVGVSMGGKVPLELLRRHPTIMFDFRGDNLVVAMVATPTDPKSIKQRFKVTLLPFIDGPFTRLSGVSAAQADQARFLALPRWLGGVKPPAPGEFREFTGRLVYFESFTDEVVDTARAWSVLRQAFPNASQGVISVNEWHTHVPIDGQPKPLEDALIAAMS